MASVAASTSNAAFQFRFPPSYAWKGCRERASERSERERHSERREREREREPPTLLVAL
jgi:hypothetical protein